MKIPLSWLAEFGELPADPHELAESLTSVGLESEVVAPAVIPEGVVTGKIVECAPHPNADRLSVCNVDVGKGEPRVIVCGAPNAEAGWVAAAALPGTRIGEFEIEKRKLRGVASEGMLCSERELGLSDSHEGIILLPAETPVGRPLSDVLSSEPILVTEPLSNRGDWMSVVGVAREVAAIAGRRLELARPDPASCGPGDWTVRIEDPLDCPRYCGRVVRGLALGPSPKWLADRLAAAGIRPISNLVDVTNYVLLELGHPLHAFDLTLLKGTEIGVRRSRSGEKLTTLDGKVRDLGASTLLITDASGPIALGGIMGGEPTMVRDGTTSIFLEGASFGPAAVRRGARHLKLVTDASARFERGVDPGTLPHALDRAVELLLDLCPGAELQHVVDAHPAPVEPLAIRLRARTLERILGFEVPPEDVRRILESLEMTVESEGGEGWEVRPPTFRRDVTAEEDLVEEVARIYGYDRIPERAQVNVAAAPFEFARVDNFGRARRILLSLDLVEVVTPPLVDGSLEDAAVREDPFFRTGIPLRNPLSSDRGVLRGSLLPCLLQVVATNQARSTSDLAVFEVSRVYEKSGESEVREDQRIGVVLSGRGIHDPGGRGAKSCDFFDMKGLLEVYVEQFWGVPLDQRDGSASPFTEGRCAEIRVDGQPIGFFGEVSAETRGAFDLPEDLPLFAAELELEKIAPRDDTRVFSPLPRYPSAVRDLAFVVPRSCRHVDLAGALRTAGGELLVEADLFDVYEGEPLGKDERSLAYTLTFRSPERSLRNEEVDELVDRIVSRVGEELGGRIR